MITQIRQEDKDQVAMMRYDGKTWEEIFSKIDLSDLLKEFHKKYWTLMQEYAK
jgi:hypothetical protein